MRMNLLTLPQWFYGFKMLSLGDTVLEPGSKSITKIGETLFKVAVKEWGCIGPYIYHSLVIWLLGVIVNNLNCSLVFLTISHTARHETQAARASRQRTCWRTNNRVPSALSANSNCDCRILWRSRRTYLRSRVSKVEISVDWERKLSCITTHR